MTSNDADTTLNTQIKTRLDYIISELKICQDANANIKTVRVSCLHRINIQFDHSEGKLPVQHGYRGTMHKILAGLIDVYKHTGE